MKKMILFTGIIIIAGLLLNISPIQIQRSSTTSPSPIPKNYREYLVDDQKLLFASFSIKIPEMLMLIPNFSQKITSPDAFQANQCRLLTNGGFYAKDNTPIGLFVSENLLINSFQKNALFNGFFSIQKNGTTRIENQIPDIDSRFALQSGPLLIIDGIAQKLTIRDDEPARRIIVAQTTGNSIVFLALFGSENTFNGPKLADVPKHLKEIEKLLGISITNALNLDGGSASAFITKDHSLTELTPVGSFFCVK